MTSPLAEPATRQFGLSWTMKKSFVSYIARMPDGRVSVTDGADLIAPDVFRYAYTECSVEGSDTVLHFHGDVRFAGHSGFLFVGIADPFITMTDGGAVISVLTPQTRLEPAERILFATAEMSTQAQTGAGCIVYRASNVRLLADGADLFGGVYAIDDLLDDFEVLVPSHCAQ